MSVELDLIIPNSENPEEVANSNFQKIKEALDAAGGAFPEGGEAGQILALNNALELVWIDPPEGGSGGVGVPPGGTTGQVLTKLSNDDGDADWQTPATGGGGTDPGGGGESNGAIVGPRTVLRRNAQWTVPGSSWGAIPWDTEVKDPLNTFTVGGDGLITVPANATLAKINIQLVHINSGGGPKYCRIERNGTVVGLQINNTSSEGGAAFESRWIDVVAGDKLAVLITNSPDLAPSTGFGGGSIIEILWANEGAGLVNPDPGGGSTDPVVTNPTGDSAIKNYDLAKLKRSRKAMTRVKTRMGRFKVGFMGDSNIAGEGAGLSGTSLKQSAQGRATPAQTAKYLGSSGIPASYANFVGYGGGFDEVLYDPRLTFSGNAANDVDALSGKYIKLTDQSGLSFDPGEAFNRFELRYLQLGGQGTFKVCIDGNATPLQTVVVASAPEAMVSLFVDIPGDLAKHTVQVVKDGGSGANYFESIQCFDTNRPKIECFNFGTAGKKAYDYFTNQNDKPWHRTKAMTTFGLDLLFIYFGINEEIQGDFGSYLSNMQGIIGAAQTANVEVVLIIHPNHSGTQDQSIIPAVILQLSAQFDVPYVDLRVPFGSNASATANGDWYDSYHPTAQGYGLFARTLAHAIMPL